MRSPLLYSLRPRLLRRIAAATANCFALVIVACGGSGGPGEPASAPTGPSVPAITAVTVMSPADVLLVGDRETFSATVTRADGTSAPATGAAWTSDNTNVATVSETGVVQAVGPGLVTITVETASIRGTRQIRVMPLFAGHWVGKSQAVSCENVDPKAPRCGLITIGGTYRLDLTLAQVGASVEGVLLLDGTRFVVRGTVADDGRLSLSGQGGTTLPGSAASQLADWATTTDGVAMSGTFTWVEPATRSAQRLLAVSRAADGQASAVAENVRAGGV